MTLSVEVVYALPAAQTVIALQLPEGSTIADALAASGIFDRHSELDPDACAVGVWGRVADRGQVLRDRDRVEIYRALTADPKQLRRRRAQSQRKA